LDWRILAKRVNLPRQLGADPPSESTGTLLLFNAGKAGKTVKGNASINLAPSPSLAKNKEQS